MRVFITGATGLIGAHTTLALLHAGHQVRLLVRDPQLAQAYFLKHGFEITDVIQGDMQDAALMEQHMLGCDAVFHAAAMVSLNPKLAQKIYQSNVASIDAVIGTAHKQGIRNIVYVSSLGAFFIPNSSQINESSPLGCSKEAYTQSKIDCECYVRSLQNRGIPIQITYPSGTFGPHDPKLNESNHSLCSALLKLIPLTSTGLQFIDARDLALIHVHLLENPPTNPHTARYMVAGHYYSWAELKSLFDRITGRHILGIPLPGWLMRAFGVVGDVIKKIHPMDFPLTFEAASLVTQWPVADSSKVLAKTGISLHTGEETLSDTIRWLAQEGYLKRNLAGVLTKHT